ncbi:hypothetical protein B296_00020384 [Ensete ventricosum]|uniref:Uncharacterized protein n=1 Tax=Ensete ventricosum TaxID=4639 RepID=A0A426Y1Y0_ENSVE|nr:hypothetical protein B296_00020384 [Ensete ventricosum]
MDTLSNSCLCKSLSLTSVQGKLCASDPCSIFFTKFHPSCDMAHDDLPATSSLPRTTGPPTWLTRRGKLVGSRYGGTNGRAADLAQVRPNPQRSYGRPDTSKADTLTCGRMPHRKDGGHGGGVRRHGKPQGQPCCYVRMIYNTHYISFCTSTEQGDGKINH